MPNDPNLFLAHNVPGCPLARWSVSSPCPGAPQTLLVTCRAPSAIKNACGYPAAPCPHKGPYRDLDEAAAELDSCLIRQALRLS